MDINKRLFQLLEEHQVKQKVLAEYIGVKSNTISEWKRRGTQPPSYKTILICDFFKIDLMWFLTGKGEKYNLNINTRNKNLEYSNDINTKAEKGTLSENEKTLYVEGKKI